MNRKIIQIQTVEFDEPGNPYYGIYALCDDGTIWIREYIKENMAWRWRQIDTETVQGIL